MTLRVLVSGQPLTLARRKQKKPAKVAAAAGGDPFPDDSIDADFGGQR